MKPYEKAFAKDQANALFLHFICIAFFNNSTEAIKVIYFLFPPFSQENADGQYNDSEADSDPIEERQML